MSAGRTPTELNEKLEWLEQVAGDRQFANTSTVLRVAVRLAKHFNCNDGVARAGQNTIGKALGLSGPTIRTAIDALEERGHLAPRFRAHKPDSPRSRDNCNRYVLLIRDVDEARDAADTPMARARRERGAALAEEAAEKRKAPYVSSDPPNRKAYYVSPEEESVRGLTEESERRLTTKHIVETRSETLAAGPPPAAASGRDPYQYFYPKDARSEAELITLAKFHARGTPLERDKDLGPLVAVMHENRWLFPAMVRIVFAEMKDSRHKIRYWGQAAGWFRHAAQRALETMPPDVDVHAQVGLTINGLTWSEREIIAAVAAFLRSTEQWPDELWPAPDHPETEIPQWLVDIARREIQEANASALVDPRRGGA